MLSPVVFRKKQKALDNSYGIVLLLLPCSGAILLAQLRKYVDKHKAAARVWSFRFSWENGVQNVTSYAIRLGLEKQKTRGFKRNFDNLPKDMQNGLRDICLQINSQNKYTIVLSQSLFVIKLSYHLWDIDDLFCKTAMHLFNKYLMEVIPLQKYSI